MKNLESELDKKIDGTDRAKVVMEMTALMIKSVCFAIELFGCSERVEEEFVKTIRAAFVRFRKDITGEDKSP